MPIGKSSYTAWKLARMNLAIHGWLNAA